MEDKLPKQEKSDQSLKVELTHERKVLRTWRAPSRPFKKRNREYYKTVAAIVFLLVVILFLVKEWILIGVILSMAFVAYVLSTVPPEEIEYTLTNNSIELAGAHVLWEQLAEYWEEEKWGQKMITIALAHPYIGRIHLMLGQEEPAEIKKILSDYIPFQPHPVKHWVERASEWLAKKVPLETS